MSKPVEVIDKVTGNTMVVPEHLLKLFGRLSVVDGDPIPEALREPLGLEAEELPEAKEEPTKRKAK